MASEDIALMAHLMRRAGFGASREELEARAAKGYEATVEELLNPTAEPVDRYEFLRYHPGFWKPITSPGMGGAAWFHTMLNTNGRWKRRWCCSGIRCSPPASRRSITGTSSSTRPTCSASKGMGDYRELLVDAGQEPGHDLLAGQLRQPRPCGQ